MKLMSERDHRIHRMGKREAREEVVERLRECLGLPDDDSTELPELLNLVRAWMHGRAGLDGARVPQTRESIREARRIYGHDGDLVMVEGKAWRVWMDAMSDAQGIRIDARAVSDADGIQCRHDVLFGVTRLLEGTIAATIMRSAARFGGPA